MLTWNETKAAANLAKHGVAFEMAARFDWESATTETDNRADYGEDRSIATGKIDSRLYVMVYVTRHDTIRVISLRKANRREIRRYDQQTR